MKPTGVVTVVLSLLALAVSAGTFALGYLQNERSEELQRRPILVFQYDGGTGWSVKNVGNGPAVNVVIVSSMHGATWSGPIRTPPIASGGEIQLRWLEDPNLDKLGAVYSGVTGASYNTVCDDDLNVFDKQNALPNWPADDATPMWEALAALSQSSEPASPRPAP
jgi:hypothetical protein